MHPRSGSRLLFEHDDTDEPVILIDAVGSHRTLRNGTKRNSLAKQTGRRLGLEFSSFKNRVQIAGCSARGPARLVVLGFLPMWEGGLVVARGRIPDQGVVVPWVSSVLELERLLLLGLLPLLRLCRFLAAMGGRPWRR